MNNKFFGVLALIGTSCLNAYAEGTYQNLFNFYSWFPGIWSLLLFSGWLCSIIVITSALYSGFAWVLLAVVNHTNEQHSSSKPSGRTN